MQQHSREFLRQLRAKTWRRSAVARVASALLMLRMRPGNPESAKRLYDRFIGRTIPRRLIGWHLESSA